MTNLEEYNRNMNVITSAIRTKRHNLFEQPLDAADDKVTVYDLGKKIKSIEGCCHKTLTKGESRTATARKVVAHGPMWIYVAIAVGMDKAGTESPL